jgi:hypothetical protein
MFSSEVSSFATLASKRLHSHPGVMRKSKNTDLNQ